MNTVFSHIIQKRFSQENEDVATDALAFIVNSSEAARSGLVKVFRGIEPDLPSLLFRTQQTEDSVRPDMWGLDGTTPRVFIENKFWAGLTENQPVAYLRLFSKSTKTSVLLVAVPETRQETVWRELLHRLSDAKVCTSNRDPSASFYRVVETDIGPILALTSWGKLLLAIETELTDDPQPRNDLLQLRALCDAADRNAFVPLTSGELTNQRMPAFVFQLNAIVQGAVDLAVTEGVLSSTVSDQCRIGTELGATYYSPQGKGLELGLGLISSCGDGTVGLPCGLDSRQENGAVGLRCELSWNRGQIMKGFFLRWLITSLP